MSFHKRNIGLSSPTVRTHSDVYPSEIAAKIPGVRPSPLDGRLTTSTGTQTLDDLLAGHGGLTLGNSLLVQENGTTDFAGALLRYYAAEGIVQGHAVHVVGMGEYWSKELPGLVGSANVDKEEYKTPDKEKMKIAWRYESLGDCGTGSIGSRAITPNRNPAVPNTGEINTATPMIFCHSYDLTKRLSMSFPISINYMTPLPNDDPFSAIMRAIHQSITAKTPRTIHRLLIPNLLSPSIYPFQASSPSCVLSFLHSLRSLLRTHSTCLSVMLTFPLFLYPRTTGLTRWIEHLCDGVLELAPFSSNINIVPPLTTTDKAGKAAEKDHPQGMVKVHKLPVLTEKGGGSGSGNDMAFSLTRKSFTITAFNLPPVEGDQDAQGGEVERGKMNVNVDF